MKKHYKIFWLGVLFAYLFFSYGAIDNTMSTRTFQGKRYNCRQVTMARIVPEAGPDATIGKYISSCEPLELTQWRDAGGLLWPYQRDILLSVDEYMQRHYWRNVALLILGLGALPMLLAWFNAFRDRARNSK